MSPTLDSLHYRLWLENRQMNSYRPLITLVIWVALVAALLVGSIYYAHYQFTLCYPAASSST